MRQPHRAMLPFAKLIWLLLLCRYVFLLSGTLMFDNHVELEILCTVV